jgi:hypothetical protein
MCNSADRTDDSSPKGSSGSCWLSTPMRFWLNGWERARRPRVAGRGLGKSLGLSSQRQFNNNKATCLAQGEGASHRVAKNRLRLETRARPSVNQERGKQSEDGEESDDDNLACWLGPKTCIRNTLEESGLS